MDEVTLGDGGYWLPELLEHMASHGIVTVCPYLAGIPDAGQGQVHSLTHATRTFATV